MKELDEKDAGEVLQTLLDAGNEITITGNALIAPSIRGRYEREQTRAAIQRLRECAKAAKHGAFDWDEWNGYRNEGKR